MKYSGIVCGIAMGIFLSGCTTMQMLGESKAEFKKGNYGSGVFQGAAAVAFGPIIDVFTLGGALDSPEKVDKVYGAAGQAYSSYAETQQAQKTAQLQAQQAALARSVQQQSSYGTVGSSNSSSSGSYSTINSSSSSSNNYGNSSSTINNGQNNSANTSKPKKVAKSLNQCISFDRNSNSLFDFLVNRCGQKIWVEWMDDGKSLGAESVVNRSTISKNRGNIVYAACPYGYSAFLPNASQPSGYKWDGRSAFECRDW